MNESTPQVPAQQNNLEKLARSRKYDQLEAEWLAAIEEEPMPLDDMLAVVHVLARRNDAEVLESLLFFLFTTHAEHAGAEPALALVRHVQEMLPDSDALRQEVGTLYRETHPDDEVVAGLAAMTVLNPAVSLAAGVAKLEKLLAMRPGQYVLDDDRGRAGRVIGVDPDARSLQVSFGEAEKQYDANAIEQLRLLPADDYRALKIFEPDRLKGLAANDPEALARLLLATFDGRLSFKEFKAHLTGPVTVSGWTKWWGAAKVLMKRSPVIQMTEGTQPNFVLRRTPMSYEDQLRAQVRIAGSLDDKVVMALDYVHQVESGQSADPAVLRLLTEALQQHLDAGADEAPSSLVAALALIHDLHATLGEPDAAVAAELADLLGDERNVADLVGPIDNDAAVTRILAFLQGAFPEQWPQLHAAVFPVASTAVCDRIVADLAAAGVEVALAGAIDSVLERPARSIGALVWIWRAVSTGRYPKSLTEPDRRALLLRLISAAGAVKRNAQHELLEQRRLIAEVRNALAHKNYDSLHAVIAGADRPEAVAIRTALEQDVALSDQTRGAVWHMLEEAHPDLFVEKKEPWEEDVIYTTEAGLARRRREFEVLANEKIPENAKAIGAAAAKGDLSENAEWTAALEERDRLTERASNIEAELRKARPITHDTAAGGRITVGTTVLARNLASGEEETFIFYGPWDTDVARRIYSYRSPLGLVFMGKKVGEEVVLRMEGDEKRWQVVAVE